MRREMIKFLTLGYDGRVHNSLVLTNIVRANSNGDTIKITRRKRKSVLYSYAAWRALKGLK